MAQTRKKVESYSLLPKGLRVDDERFTQWVIQFADPEIHTDEENRSSFFVCLTEWREMQDSTFRTDVLLDATSADDIRRIFGDYIILFSYTVEMLENLKASKKYAEEKEEQKKVMAKAAESNKLDTKVSAIDLRRFASGSMLNTPQTNEQRRERLIGEIRMLAGMVEKIEAEMKDETDFSETQITPENAAYLKTEGRFYTEKAITEWFEKSQKAGKAVCPLGGSSGVNTFGKDDIIPFSDPKHLIPYAAKQLFNRWYENYNSTLQQWESKIKELAILDQIIEKEKSRPASARTANSSAPSGGSIT